MAESSSCLSRDEWNTVVENCLQTSEFDILDVKTRPLGAGSGFLGDHTLAEVSVQRSNKTEAVTLHFFVKSVPQLKNQRIVSEQTGAFKREVNALREIFVQLKSVLNNSGKDMPWGCECYLIRDDLIVLEDLGARGFKTIGSRGNLSYQHAELVVKTLANLHAASLIYEERQPKQPFRLNSVYELKECFFTMVPEQPGFQFVRTSIQGILQLLALMKEEKISSEVETKIERAIMSLFDLQRAWVRYRNVICHGDLWRNNILFRTENGSPVAATLVDFQIIRYAPPANDIMSFLYLSMDRAFRNEFSSQLIKAYYSRLSHNLKQHGLFAEDILPWKEFKDSCEYYKKLGIVLAPVERQVTLMNHLGELFGSSETYDEFLTGDRSKEVSVAFNDPEYREKMSEIIEELMELVENE